MAQESQNVLNSRLTKLEGDTELTPAKRKEEIEAIRASAAQNKYTFVVQKAQQMLEQLNSQAEKAGASPDELRKREQPFNAAIEEVKEKTQGSVQAVEAAGGTPSGAEPEAQPTAEERAAQEKIFQERNERFAEIQQRIPEVRKKITEAQDEIKAHKNLLQYVRVFEAYKAGNKEAKAEMDSLLSQILRDKVIIRENIDYWKDKGSTKLQEAIEGELTNKENEFKRQLTELQTELEGLHSNK